jgi:anaerobic selenocysteine-containing dehydrogenase
MGLQAGPYSAASGSDFALSLDTLKQYPSGIDLGPLQSQLPQRLFTPDKRIHCDTPEPLADLERLRAVATAATEANALLLIGRRDVRSNNSWMHNFRRLVKGKNRCTLLINPEDMASRDIKNGQWVLLSSRVGQLRVRASGSEDMTPGVVSLPHGWGHGREGIRMEIAAKHAGVSCNDLTDELAVDALSGNAAVNGVPVSLQAC